MPDPIKEPWYDQVEDKPIHPQHGVDHPRTLRYTPDHPPGEVATPIKVAPATNGLAHISPGNVLNFPENGIHFTQERFKHG
jgi:hypothetical protein